MTDFIAAMDKLAAEIAEAACNTGNPGDDKVPLVDKIDAFKALMPYYVQKLKKKGGEDDPDDDQPNFDNFQNQINGVKTFTGETDGSDEPGVRSN